MKLLIDTHVILWQSLEPNRLSSIAAPAIVSSTNQIHVSMASIWEIAIKMSVGKLKLNRDLDTFIEKAVVDNGFVIVAIESAHASESIRLPWVHKDPFDRMLAAQARVEKMAIISADAVMDGYGIVRIW